MSRLLDHLLNETSRARSALEAATEADRRKLAEEAVALHDLLVDQVRREAHRSAALDSAILRIDEARSLLAGGAENLDSDVRWRVLGFLRDADLLLRGATDPGRQRGLPWARLDSGLANVVCVVALAAFVFVLARDAYRWVVPDLAADATWRASSSTDGYPVSGRGFAYREGAGEFFFQTAVQENPWIEFDLGRRVGVSYIEIKNHPGCCQDWAIPLLVELSEDRATWRQVCRVDYPFYVHRCSPRRSMTRYLRLSVPRATSLRLSRVEVR